MIDSEVDKFTSSLEGKNPKEINREIRESIPNNLLLLSKLLPEMKETHENTKKIFPEVKKLIDELKIFYKDLESDGVIKIERELFNNSIEESIKEREERESGFSSFEKVKRNQLPYREAFKELNNFYHGSYCFLTKREDLKKIAEKLNGRTSLSEGDIIQELKKYKQGKYESIFNCLNPQIKNSLSHKNSFIDQKDPKITYTDRDKPKLNLTLKEFNEICNKLFYLQLAHDIITWEFFEDFYLDVAKKMEIVNDFTNKYEGKVVRKEGTNTSLYGIGKFLEDKKDQW